MPLRMLPAASAISRQTRQAGEMCEATVTLSGSRLSSKLEEVSSGEDEVCWICHEGQSAAMPLASPCNCRGMKAHRRCLARWQLQQAGRA